MPFYLTPKQDEYNQELQICNKIPELQVGTWRMLGPLVQYFKSFDEEPGRDVESTALRFIALQQLASIKGWVKPDFKFMTEHENDDKSTTTFEVQVGKMLKSTVGVYFEGLFALGGQKPHDDGFGIAGRFLF